MYNTQILLYIQQSLFIYLFLLANEGLSTQNNSKIRVDAHDRYESRGVAERADPGDQARDTHLLRPGKQLS